MPFFADVILRHAPRQTARHTEHITTTCYYTLDAFHEPLIDSCPFAAMPLLDIHAASAHVAPPDAARADALCRLTPRRRFIITVFRQRRC